MVKFNRFTLSNGLRVIVHEDKTTPMAVLIVSFAKPMFTRSR